MDYIIANLIITKPDTAERDKVKTLPFFKFDAESWLTGKVQVLTVDEIGIFINLAARIWKAGGALRNDRFLPRLLGASREQFDAAMQDFLELDIITETDGFLRIKFLDNQLEERAAFISKCAKGGRKGRKSHAEQPTSDLKGNSNTPEETPEQPASNKKEERREQKEDKERESNNAPAPEPVDFDKVLGENLAHGFRCWLKVWQEMHGDGQPMPVYTQEAQLARLLALPEDIRHDAVKRAISGCWKQIQDIRHASPAAAEAAAKRTRQTGTLNTEPKYSNNERGAKR